MISEVLAPAIGCRHEPLTTYCESSNTVYCSRCADEYNEHHHHTSSSSSSALEGAVVNDCSYLSTHAFETQRLMKRLERKRELCLQTLSGAQTLLQLEKIRDEMKEDVDAALLSVIKAVDTTMQRLHGSIDAFIDERVELLSTVNESLRKFDRVKTQVISLQLGSNANIDAVTCHKLLLKFQENMNQVTSASAKLSMPLKLRLKRELALVDLSKLRVVRLERAISEDGKSEKEVERGLEDEEKEEAREKEREKEEEGIEPVSAGERSGDVSASKRRKEFLQPGTNGEDLDQASTVTDSMILSSSSSVPRGNDFYFLASEQRRRQKPQHTGNYERSVPTTYATSAGETTTRFEFFSPFRN